MPGEEIDITTDLTDGSDGALGDKVPYNGQATDAQQQLPPGTQPVNGDARPVNTVDPLAPAKTELSLRDQLSSAFKGKEGEPTNQAAAQSAAANNQVEQALTLTKDSAGKYRMPDGTFASDQQIQAFEAAQSVDTSKQQSPILAGLTAQEAQQFQSLPAELRQYVERTMEGLNTRAERYSEYDTIERSILGPRRAAFAAEGTSPVVALNQLFNLSDFAGRDPGNFVLWFSQQHNLDLDALLDARDADSANVSPEVQELRGQVERLTGVVTGFEQRGQQATQSANLTSVQNFAAAKDDKGGYLRPYLTEVMDEWASQITAIRVANPSMPNEEVLQKAYDNACWTNQTVRGKMQQMANDAARTSEAMRVDKAKKAGSGITGAPAGSAPPSPNNSNRTLREEISSQFAAARAV